jgi:hypothetical protein
MMPVTAHLQDHIALSPDLKISHEAFRTSTNTSVVGCQWLSYPYSGLSHPYLHISWILVGS